jgi:hypothetical protein
LKSCRFWVTFNVAMEERGRRFSVVLIVALAIVGSSLYASVQNQAQKQPPPAPVATSAKASGQAVDKLESLPVKGRAPKTGYSREQFSAGWADAGACDMRNYILKRDMTDVATKSNTDCTVESGTLNDPYTGKIIHFTRGVGTSDDVQIDHVVAVSDAWQKGAQQLDVSARAEFYNDPLNLLAVDGPANQKKSDGDAATWLPPSKSYRCRYVSRQIAVKAKYSLWVTQAEHDAMKNVLATCHGQTLPSVE